MDQSPTMVSSVVDVYAPVQIAEDVCKVGLAKVPTPVPTMVALATLAGAVVSLGVLLCAATVFVAFGLEFVYLRSMRTRSG